jgi:hypothetical protein
VLCDYRKAATAPLGEKIWRKKNNLNNKANCCNIINNNIDSTIGYIYMA